MSKRLFYINNNIRSGESIGYVRGLFGLYEQIKLYDGRIIKIKVKKMPYSKPEACVFCGVVD